MQDFIKLFAHQMAYSEWLKVDPELQPNIVGRDGELGSKLTWVSQNKDKKKNVGVGEQEIIKLTNSSIEVALRLFKPMPANCTLIHEFKPVSVDSTLYTCTFSTIAPFPANLPSYLIGRKFIIGNQQKTLNNVKIILEKTK